MSVQGADILAEMDGPEDNKAHAGGFLVLQSEQVEQDPALLPTFGALLAAFYILLLLVMPFHS